MTAAWVGATHSIKLLYLRHPLAGFGYHVDQLFSSDVSVHPMAAPIPGPIAGHRHLHSNASTTAIHHYLLVRGLVGSAVQPRLCGKGLP